jgi:hypothetical protein
MPPKAVKGILATSASLGVTLFEPKLAGYRIMISEQKTVEPMVTSGQGADEIFCSASARPGVTFPMSKGS